MARSSDETLGHTLVPLQKMTSTASYIRRSIPPTLPASLSEESELLIIKFERGENLTSRSDVLLGGTQPSTSERRLFSLRFFPLTDTCAPFLFRDFPFVVAE